MPDSELVIIDYEDLKNDPKNHTLSHQLSKAFSSHNALGVIAIRNIPNFLSTKQSFLPLAHKLAHLPHDYLENELTDKPSMYNTGWSHGKEKLGDRPDFNKASFYFNPITDTPGTQEEREKFPASYPVNKWPDREMLPGFDEGGKKMGRMMREIVALLAKHVDVYIREKCGCNSYESTMGDEMEKTEKVKGRMLYYFPLDGNEAEETGGDHLSSGVGEDSWIGWHNDSGFFTALAGDIFVDHDTGQQISRNEVDPNAGLMVMNRSGEIIKVDIPEDCMAVQIGECLQIISGGHVVATPHCVRGVDPKWNKGGDQKVARISFPCFVDTLPSFPLKVPDGCSMEGVLKSSVNGCAKVPPLSERWAKDGMDFGSFLQTTFEKYYEWGKAA